MRLFPLRMIWGILIFSSVFCFGLPPFIQTGGSSFQAYAQGTLPTDSITLGELRQKAKENLDKLGERINEVSDTRERERLNNELKELRRRVNQAGEEDIRRVFREGRARLVQDVGYILMIQRHAESAGITVEEQERGSSEAERRPTEEGLSEEEKLRRQYAEEERRRYAPVPQPEEEGQPLQTSDGRDCARGVRMVLDSIEKRVEVALEVTSPEIMRAPQLFVVGPDGRLPIVINYVRGEDGKYRAFFDAPPEGEEWNIFLCSDAVTRTGAEATLLGTIKDGKISLAENPVLSKETAEDLATPDRRVGMNDRVNDSREVQTAQANDDFAVASSPEGLSPVNRPYIDFGEGRAPTGKRETLQEQIIRLSRRGPAGYPGGVEYFATDRRDVEISPVYDSSANKGALSVRGKSLLVGDRSSSLTTLLRKERQKPLECVAGIVDPRCLQEEERGVIGH